MMGRKGRLEGGRGDDPRFYRKVAELDIQSEQAVSTRREEG